MERRNPEHRQAVTRKLKDPKWRGPDGARLAIDVLDTAGGEFAVSFAMNGWGAYAGMKQGHYYATKSIAKSDEWQTLEIAVDEFIPLDDSSPTGLLSWQYMTTLGSVADVRKRENGHSVLVAGSGWPKHRRLKNLRWIGGQNPKTFSMPGQNISADAYRRIFQKEIDKSLEREKRGAQNPKSK